MVMRAVLMASVLAFGIMAIGMISLAFDADYTVRALARFNMCQSIAIASLSGFILYAVSTGEEEEKHEH